MYFLALSHAPPPLVIATARKKPVTIDPTSVPPIIFAPPLLGRTKPSSTTMIGTPIGISAGSTISRNAASVTMSTVVP